MTIQTAAACVAMAAGTVFGAAWSDNPLAPQRLTIVSDHEIILDGVTYGSWDDVAATGYFDEETRCGTRAISKAVADELRAPGDCSYNNTSVLPAYEPSTAKYRIPVVVHVIRTTGGTGNLSLAQVQSQIDILNEDFLALAGTNGALGTDTQIEFFLATEDPSGNPTTGVTYTTNNTWFNDSGTYYNTLAWDTNRYLNIYTNSASGALGYVPDLPQGGIAGLAADRVVCLYSAFGRNSPLAPYNQGRTATHEVGHYLGLWHTFDNGCGTVANCSTTGDRICDTNPESSPVFGCPGSNSQCGGPSPYRNYMDYTDDLCMTNFTPNQANRMRCSLIHYRPNVFSVASAACNEADLDASGSLSLDDVSLFVANLPDLTGDTVFTLDDVAAFATAFNNGCP